MRATGLRGRVESVKCVAGIKPAQQGELPPLLKVHHTQYVSAPHLRSDHLGLVQRHAGAINQSARLLNQLSTIRQQLKRLMLELG